MARAAATNLDEKQLSKGELRKLNALRKSLGNDIAEKAFTEWYATQPASVVNDEDKNARLIVEALQPLIEQNKLRIPRGGYRVRRGRGRVIVEPASD